MCFFILPDSSTRQIYSRIKMHLLSRQYNLGNKSEIRLFDRLDRWKAMGKQGSM